MNLVFRPLRQCLLLFFAIIILITVPIIVTTVAIIFGPIRLIVWVLSRIFRPDLQGFVSGLHSGFTLGKSANFPLNTIGIAVLKGKVSAELFKHNIATHVLPLKRPSGELVYSGLHRTWTRFLGYPFWKKDPNFDLNFHVRNYDYTCSLALHSPCRETDVHKVIGGLLKAPWKKGRSPWEILIVSEYEGNSAIIFRVDHVLADGFSILELFKVMTQSEWPLPKFRGSESKPSILQKLGLLFKLPYDLAENALETFSSSRLPHRGLGSKSEIIFCSSPPVSTEAIKLIKNHYKVNYATVIFAAVSGAVERALRESGEKVPKDYLTSMVVPKPHHPGGLCIHASLLTAKWPLASSAERLQTFQKGLQKLSQSTAPLAYTTIVKLAALLPVSITTSFSRLVDGTTNVNTCVTSLPVTTGPSFMEGMEITELITANSNVFGMALQVSTGGVNNKQRVSFCVSKNLFESEAVAANMGLYFSEEIQTYLDLMT